ncbi:hypothetical protein Cni_G01834 [Canna indica]|uniref:Uncharacterized protein n=1 Tax=Canna indica TaxID=4628 RepID=A0AAQ3JNL6_9LILI|nr:hypothetical protein Cni_G01834 [Canna indica]
MAKCSKAPVEVRMLFKELLNNKREQRVRDVEERQEFERRATEDVRHDQYDDRGGDDEEDRSLQAAICASLEQEAFERDRMYHPRSQFEYGSGNGSSGTNSIASSSVAGAMNRSGSIPSTHYIGWSSSMMAPPTQSRGGGIRGFFSNLGQTGGRKSLVDLIDLDPRAYPSCSSKQLCNDDAWSETKKWELGRAISK